MWGEDPAHNVAYEAVDFGTALLEGGNPTAQAALLQWFQNPDVRLVASFCQKLRKSAQVCMCPLSSALVHMQRV